MRSESDSAVHAVRQHILEILKERTGATVAELADSLQMAPVSVRHHLDILQGDNLICVERLERSGSVGRPQQVYALTPEANEHFPDNFAALAAGLLRQIKQFLPPEQVECAFKAMAHEFCGAYVASELAELSTEERLERVTAFLNERGYLARWEEDDGPDDGYLLHKCNCPYADVSSEHHELCLMDQALINELVGQPAKRIVSMADKGVCCTYRIPRSEAVRPPEFELTLHSHTPAAADSRERELES